MADSGNSEMVEKVARAICKSEGYDPDYEGQHGVSWKEFADHARAAIEAMMDMDGRMWVAGRDEFVKQADRFSKPDRHEVAMAIADRAPEHIFKAMLSAALSPSLKEQERT